MKFGEHLTSHVTPEWRTQYIDYDVNKELHEMFRKWWCNYFSLSRLWKKCYWKSLSTLHQQVQRLIGWFGSVLSKSSNQWVTCMLKPILSWDLFVAVVPLPDSEHLEDGLTPRQRYYKEFEETFSVFCEGQVKKINTFFAGMSKIAILLTSLRVYCLHCQSIDQSMHGPINHSMSNQFDALRFWFPLLRAICFI